LRDIALNLNHVCIKKSLKIPNGQSEAINQRRTANTNDKRKITKGQIMIFLSKGKVGSERKTLKTFSP
jgi:hypothetical protein